MSEITDSMIDAKIRSMPALVECYEVGDSNGPTDTHATMRGAVTDFVGRFIRNKKPFIKFEDGTICRTKDEIVKKLFKE